MARKSTIAAPSVATGKSGFALGQKRTDAEWDEIVLKHIVPALQAGATMQSQRELYGASRFIRASLIRQGFGTPADVKRGTKNPVQPLKVKGVAKSVLAKRIAARRQAGVCWDRLVFETSMDADALRTLLRENGMPELATGRVIHSERGVKRAAKKAAEAEAAAQAAQPARKPRVRRTKVTS